jgi:hypothetical protein
MRAVAAVAGVVVLVLGGCTAGGGEPTPLPQESSSAPANTTVPDDYVAVATLPSGLDPAGLLTLTPPPPDGAFVVGPHYYLGLDGVGAAPQIGWDHSAVFFYPAAGHPAPSGWTKPTTLHAGPGHELLVAHLVAQPGKTLNGDTGVGPSSTTGSTVDLSVRVGQGTSVSLGDRVENGALILVSVPSGGDGLLTVDDGSDHPQSLHLRSGTRADTPAGMYPRRTQDVGQPSFVFRLTVDGADKIMPIALHLSVELVPWQWRHNWAPAHHTWLLVHIEVTNAQAPAGLRLDATKSFTLSGAAGAAPHPVADSIEVPYAASVDQQPVAVFDVPDSFRTATLQFNPTGTFALLAVPAPSDPNAYPIRIYSAQHTSMKVALPA